MSGTLYVVRVLRASGTTARGRQQNVSAQSKKKKCWEQAKCIPGTWYLVSGTNLRSRSAHERRRPRVQCVHYRGKYRHYSGNRHYSAHCDCWRFPFVPSDFTGTIAGSRHYSIGATGGPPPYSSSVCYHKYCIIVRRIAVSSSCQMSGAMSKSSNRSFLRCSSLLVATLRYPSLFRHSSMLLTPHLLVVHTLRRRLGFRPRHLHNCR